MTANGVTPEEMMRVVNQQVPTPFRDIDLGTLLSPNYLDFVRSLALMPLRSLGVVRTMLQNIGQVSIMDLAVGLAEGLPPGLYDGSSLQRTSRTSSPTPTARTTSGCSRTSSS